VEGIGQTHGAGFPAGAGEHDQATVGEAFEDRSIFDRQHLTGHERPLRKESLQIVDDQRTLAQSGDDGLLMGVVAQFALGGVTLLGALLQGGSHLVKFFRQLSQFALHLLHAGPRLQVAARQSQHRL
jgi:hypothetical protein